MKMGCGEFINLFRWDLPVNLTPLKIHNNLNKQNKKRVDPEIHIIIIILKNNTPLLLLAVESSDFLF